MPAPILLIDDDEILRKTLNHALSTYFEAEVIEAANGKIGLTAIGQRTDIYLAIVDIFMPDMDGLEFIRSVRQLGLDIKILAISGGSSNLPGDFLTYAKAMGATDVLYKPIELELFVQTVKNLLHTSGETT